MSYETLESGTDTSGGDETLKIFLYPNTSSMDDNCEGEVREGVMNFIDQIFPDLIWSYEVLISYEHPNISGSDFDEVYTNWLNYSNGKDDHIGVHMLYYQKDTSGSKGRTQSPNTDPDNKGAWNKPYDSVIGRYWETPYEAVLNGVAHEVMHALINEEIRSVEKKIDDDTEHDLGTVYSGTFGDGPVTPMATNYADTHGRHGDCATDAPWNGTYDHNLTDCTYDGLYYTSDNHL